MMASMRRMWNREENGEREEDEPENQRGKEGESEEEDFLRAGSCSLAFDEKVLI